jgi:hypothetical protein
MDAAGRIRVCSIDVDDLWRGIDFSPLVIPAKAGIQGNKRIPWPWIPAFAGLTEGNDYWARIEYGR